MAKKSKPADGAGAKVNKSQMVRDYLKTHKGAKPKEIVAYMNEQGVEISPNMVSIIKAKAKVKRAKRKAKEATAAQDSSAAAKGADASTLDAVLTLYKAAQGTKIPGAKIKAAFISLVDQLS